MNPFRSILATLLALLIACPLCCCAAMAEASAPRTCCVEKKDSGEQDKTPCACACKAKEPREKAKDLELPSIAVLPLMPVGGDLSWLTPPAVGRLPMAATPHTGCDPPRLLLARYSRWLN